MLPLDDPRWNTYSNAMGSQGEVVPQLRELLTGGASPAIWDHFWNYLDYQGDIGDISFAAVPYLAEFLRKSAVIDWNAVALISSTELARSRGHVVPAELQEAYFATLRSMPRLLAEHPQTEWDSLTTQCAVSCIALAKGQPQLGLVYAEMGLEEGLQWLEEQDELECADDE